MLKDSPGIRHKSVSSLPRQNKAMKSTFYSVLLFSALFMAQKTKAQDYRFALGIRLSNSAPTLNNSVTGKYFVTDRNAVEGIVSFGSRFGLGALLEIHRPFTNVPQLKWFYGGGLFVGFEDKDTYLGPTGILGLDYKFTDVPINLSLDWKPELNIIPDIEFVPDAFAFTVRFTLK